MVKIECVCFEWENQWRFGWKYSVDDEWIMIPMMMMISQSVVWNRIVDC